MMTSRSADHEEAPPTIYERVGRRILLERGTMTQAELGRRVGAILGEDEIPQTTISRWEKGRMGFTLHQVVALERALGLSPGALFVAAEVVPPKFRSSDVETMLMADPDVAPEFRADAVAIHAAMVRMTAAMQSPSVERLILDDTRLQPADAKTLVALYKRFREAAKRSTTKSTPRTSG